MRKLVLLLLFFLPATPTIVSAQPWKEPDPPDFTTFLDLQIGSTGGEVGLSYQRSDLLAVGIFAEALYNQALHNISSNYLTGFKLKFYRTSTPTRFFLGPVAGAHGFGRQFRPFAGLSLGYDHYTDFLTEERKSRYRFGVELKAGTDIQGDLFIGISVGFGFGWNNRHIRSPRRNI